MSDARTDSGGRVEKPLPEAVRVEGVKLAGGSALPRVSVGRLFIFVVVVVVGVLGFMGRGTFGIAQPSDGPLSVSTTEGPFRLTISSPHGLYRADEPVKVKASLSYEGAETSVRIAHGYETPLGFGIVEPLNGTHLSAGWLLSCESSTLTRGAPIEATFWKSGGDFSDEDPNASALKAFFADPVLRLPAGTWHIYAAADFEMDHCGLDAQRYQMRAELTIVVPAGDGSIPTAPLPTPTMNPLDMPVGDDTQDGPIQLTLTSPHGRYKAGDPIEVTAGLAQGDDGIARGPITTYGGSDGPVAFRLEQVNGPIAIEPILLPDCAKQVTLPLYKPLQIPFRKSGTVPGDAPDPAYWKAWLADPVLRLPAGTWQITAFPNFAGLGGCGTPGPNLRPTITITVTP